MRQRQLAWAAVVLLLACGDAPAGPAIFEDVVATDAVIGRLDPARTYEYRFIAVRPESVLTTLLDAGLPVDEAYLPLDNLCLDPRGPAFTVVLVEPDVRVLAHDFDPGTGRLACATLLRRFRVR